MTGVLALRGVTKRFGRRGPWVLAGADLVLAPGERVTVVGSNGSGKSTLVRIAAGVTSASGGAVVVPRRVGYVPERQAARCAFTGADYLTHMGRIRGLSADAVTRRSGELLERLRLDPGADVPWTSLSKGNRQKVVIAQAFLGPVDLVVLDEPWNGLDADAAGVFEQLVAEAGAEGTAVLATAHAAARAGAVRTYRLRDGRLVEDQDPPSDRIARDSATIALVTPRADGGTAAILRALPGVVGAEASGHRLVLVVAATASDDVLRAALAAGWSVASVRRHRMGDPP